MTYDELNTYAEGGPWGGAEPSMEASVTYIVPPGKLAPLLDLLRGGLHHPVFPWLVAYQVQPLDRPGRVQDFPGGRVRVDFRISEEPLADQPVIVWGGG